jgi:hypothetical protein
MRVTRDLQCFIQNKKLYLGSVSIPKYTHIVIIVLIVLVVLIVLLFVTAMQRVKKFHMATAMHLL